MAPPLQAASELASELGDAAASAQFAAASEEVKAALLAHFWDEEAGYFARMVTPNAEGMLTRDMTCDASAYALFAFGVLPADDPKVAAMMGTMGRKLWVKAGVGGLARYERDYYFRVSEDFDKVPGNPWIICTLWLADWYIATARKKADLRGALDLLEWAAHLRPADGRPVRAGASLHAPAALGRAAHLVARAVRHDCRRLSGQAGGAAQKGARGEHGGTYVRPYFCAPVLSGRGLRQGRRLASTFAAVVPSLFVRHFRPGRRAWRTGSRPSAGPPSR